jgi:23S rRNA (cytosine1962-C5)-methyltransferase
VVGDRGAARARSGHPWIYRTDIAEAEGEAGDIVAVFDRKATFLGLAFYNPNSEMNVRAPALSIRKGSRLRT